MDDRRKRYFVFVFVMVLGTRVLLTLAEESLDSAHVVPKS